MTDAQWVRLARAGPRACAGVYLATAVRAAWTYAETRDHRDLTNARFFWARGAAVLRRGTHGACCVRAVRPVTGGCQ